MNTGENDGDAIVAEGLHKSYGHVQALRGLSLEVRRGEIFGLLGANGAGKTTLIKTLVGLTKPDRGTVRVLGLDPLRQKRAVRRQIGYMPQAPVLYEDLTARQNIAFFARAHHLPDLAIHIDEVLDFVGLTERQHDRVYGFSGGMKQRLSLACALAHRPALLLLDEPTTGVDPKLREAFWAYFRRMTNDGTTILMSTHQMDEALYCDRLVVMRDGIVLACDSPRALLARGRATVRIWDGADVESQTLQNYPETLPAMLAKFDLKAVSRIEIDQDTLETVVLDLIREKVGEGVNHG